MAKQQRARRGRPPKPHRFVSYKLSVELADWLDEASRRLGRTKTALVEEGLELLRKQSKLPRS